MVLPNHHEGEHASVLRGVMDVAEDRIVWWPDHLCSHAQGRNMLRMPADPRYIEVEVHVLPNGTLTLGWQRCQPGEEDRFLAHPTMSGLVDGCLARNGRQIRLRGGRIHLLDIPAADDDVVDIYAVRTPLWKALEEQADAWARTRRRVLPDGTPVPPITSIRPWRNHLRSEVSPVGSRSPVPTIGIAPDGAIIASWRATGSWARMRFFEDAISMEAYVHGRHVTIGPWAAKTYRQSWNIPVMAVHDIVHRMRSAEETRP